MGCAFGCTPYISFEYKRMESSLTIDSYVVAVGKSIGQSQRWGWPFVDNFLKQSNVSGVVPAWVIVGNPTRQVVRASLARGWPLSVDGTPDPL